jgi:hypothetical protein
MSITIETPRVILRLIQESDLLDKIRFSIPIVFQCAYNHGKRNDGALIRAAPHQKKNIEVKILYVVFIKILGTYFQLYFPLLVSVTHHSLRNPIHSGYPWVSRINPDGFLVILKVDFITYGVQNLSHMRA